MNSRIGRALWAALIAFGLQGRAGGADAFRAAPFDLPAARRVDTLEAQELPPSVRGTAGVVLREVRFSSYAWDEFGAAQIIRIAAFVALPSAAAAVHSLPVVICAHGLGAQADAADAMEIARNLHVVAVALSAPGSGASEGVGPTAEDPRPIFRVRPTGSSGQGEADVRPSWLYQYAYALLRAVTYAGTLPEVDPRALVVTGFSMGGLATWIVGGIDDRVRGILPIAAAGGLAAAAAEETWFRRLVLASGGLQPTDAGPRGVFRQLDPLVFAARQRGVVYMLVGAQDEYFPLNQVVRTYKAVRASIKSLEIVADYDHGWYFGAGCPAACMPGASLAETGERNNPPMLRAACPASCPARCPAGATPPYCGPQGSYNRHEDFQSRRSLLLRALVSQVAANPHPHAPAPPAPFVQRVRNQVVVRSDMSPLPRIVRLAVSENAGYTFGQYVLARESDGAWHHRRPVSAEAILIAEVETADGATATSIPLLPRNYRPHVRPFGL